VARAREILLLRGPPAQYGFIIADWYSLSRITYNYFSFYEIDSANSNWHLGILKKLSGESVSVSPTIRELTMAAPVALLQD